MGNTRELSVPIAGRAGIGANSYQQQASQQMPLNRWQLSKCRAIADIAAIAYQTKTSEQLLNNRWHRSKLRAIAGIDPNC